MVITEEPAKRITAMGDSAQGVASMEMFKGEWVDHCAAWTSLGDRRTLWIHPLRRS
jgi:hypothetical protein